MPRLRRLVLAVLTVGAVLALLQEAALAHVEASATTAPDGTSTVTFAFSHGCGTSQPTTSLKVKLPDGTAVVTPTSAPAGFQGSVSGTELTWSGGSVPYSQEASFVATMRLAGKQGDTIFLPTVQGCAGGDEPWLEKTTDPEAPAAAPRVVLAQTVDTAAPTTVATTRTTTSAAPTTTAAAASGTTPTTVPPLIPQSTPSNTSGAVVFYVVCAVLAVGALVIFLRRPNRPSRRPPDSPPES